MHIPRPFTRKAACLLSITGSTLWATAIEAYPPSPGSARADGHDGMFCGAQMQWCDDSSHFPPGFISSATAECPVGSGVGTQPCTADQLLAIVPQVLAHDQVDSVVLFNNRVHGFSTSGRDIETYSMNGRGSCGSRRSVMQSGLVYDRGCFGNSGTSTIMSQISTTGPSRSTSTSQSTSSSSSSAGPEPTSCGITYPFCLSETNERSFQNDGLRHPACGVLNCTELQIESDVKQTFKDAYQLQTYAFVTNSGLVSVFDFDTDEFIRRYPSQCAPGIDQNVTVWDRSCLEINDVPSALGLCGRFVSLCPGLLTTNPFTGPSGLCNSPILCQAQNTLAAVYLSLERNPALRSYWVDGSDIVYTLYTDIAGFLEYNASEPHTNLQCDYTTKVWMFDRECVLPNEQPITPTSTIASSTSTSRVAPTNTCDIVLNVCEEALYSFALVGPLATCYPSSPSGCTANQISSSAAQFITYNPLLQTYGTDVTPLSDPGVLVYTWSLDLNAFLTRYAASPTDLFCSSRRAFRLFDRSCINNLPSSSPVAGATSSTSSTLVPMSTTISSSMPVIS